MTMYLSNPTNVALLTALFRLGGEVRDRKGRCSSILAEHAGVTPAWAYQVLREMEAHGLIVRAVVGRRTNRIAATRKGRLWLEERGIPLPEVGGVLELEAELTAIKQRLAEVEHRLAALRKGG